MTHKLTDDEFIVLKIASTGVTLAPIGRWEKPIKVMTALGLMKPEDAVNYRITDKGMQAVYDAEDEVARAFIAANNEAYKKREAAEE